MFTTCRRPEIGRGIFLCLSVHVYDVDEVFSLSNISDMPFSTLSEAHAMADAWSSWYMDTWRRSKDYNKTMPPLGWNRAKAAEKGIIISHTFYLVSLKHMQIRLRKLAIRVRGTSRKHLLSTIRTLKRNRKKWKGFRGTKPRRRL